LVGRLRFGAPDESLTPASGVVAVAELVGRLGVTGALDDAVGQIKTRDRGLSAGEFLVVVAQAQMLGAQFWVDLDRRRAAPPTVVSQWQPGGIAEVGEHPEHVALLAGVARKKVGDLLRWRDRLR
jgi:hypothetical protein